MKVSSKKLPSVISDGVLDEGKVTFPKYVLSSKSSCGDKQCLEYVDKAVCVDEDIQAKELHLATCKADQMHGDLLYSKDYYATNDFLKAAQKLDCIDKAISVVHKGDTSSTARFKTLHDQNRVFDKGKNLCSFFGGA